MDTKLNNTFSKHFWVTQGGSPVTGLLESEFLRQVFYNGSTSSVQIAIHEVDASGSPGLYRADLVPDKLGSWFFYVQSVHYTTEPSLVQEDLRVLSFTTDDIYSFINAVPPGDAVLVDTDFGGTDNLRYTDCHGSGISGADVRAYLKDDYDGGHLGTSFIKSNTTTDVDGRLTSPLVLSPNYWYKIVYVKPGYVGEIKELYV